MAELDQDDAPTEPIRGLPRPRRRRARTALLASTAVLVLVVAAIGIARFAGADRAAATATRAPAPPSAATTDPVPPGPATTDTAGRALPAAVVAGARRVLAALTADDLPTLQATYTPDRTAGVAPWSVTRSRLADGALRASLATALTRPPQARPEVAYLFSDGDRGVGMTRAGTVAFYGTGRTNAAPTSSTAGAPPAADPTLGHDSGPYQRGFGDVRPDEISAGGDPTGMVEGVRWSSWGGPTATGTGTTTWVPPDAATFEGVLTPAVIVASNLGPCHGQTAYRTIAWYFPSKGETARTASSGFPDICDGP